MYSRRPIGDCTSTGGVRVVLRLSSSSSSSSFVVVAVVIFFSIFCFFVSSFSSVFVFVFFLVVAVFEISRDDEAPLFAFFFSFADDDDDDDRSDGLPLLFPSLFFGVLEEEGDVPFSLALELVLLLSLLLFNIFFFFSSLYVTKFTTHLLHPRAAYLHLEHPGGFTEGGDILTRALLCVCVCGLKRARVQESEERESWNDDEEEVFGPSFPGALLSFFLNFLEAEIFEFCEGFFLVLLFSLVLFVLTYTHKRIV